VVLIKRDLQKPYQLLTCIFLYFSFLFVRYNYKIILAEKAWGGKCPPLITILKQQAATILLPNLLMNKDAAQLYTNAQSP
jgi:hypothetical protein